MSYKKSGHKQKENTTQGCTDTLKFPAFDLLFLSKAEILARSDSERESFGYSKENLPCETNFLSQRRNENLLTQTKSKNKSAPRYVYNHL